MAEYIKREAVLEWFRPYTHEDILLEPVDVISEIRGIPAADAVVLPCQKGAVLIRDNQKCVADHWNILLTAFNEEKQVRLFDLDEVEAALAKMDGERKEKDA